MSDVVDLLEAGWSVVLTHGNGPQVGHLMQMDGSFKQPDGFLGSSNSRHDWPFIIVKWIQYS